MSIQKQIILQLTDRFSYTLLSFIELNRFEKKITFVAMCLYHILLLSTTKFQRKREVILTSEYNTSQWKFPPLAWIRPIFYPRLSHTHLNWIVKGWHNGSYIVLWVIQSSLNHANWSESANAIYRGSLWSRPWLNIIVWSVGVLCIKVLQLFILVMVYTGYWLVWWFGTEGDPME